MYRKLLRKLSRYLDKLYRNEHLRVHKNDIKCSNCNEWYSISGINHKHYIEDTEFGVKTSCGQCGCVSYWNLEIAQLLFYVMPQESPNTKQLLLNGK